MITDRPEYVTLTDTLTQSLLRGTTRAFPAHTCTLERVTEGKKLKKKSGRHHTRERTHIGFVTFYSVGSCILAREKTLANKR